MNLALLGLPAVAAAGLAFALTPLAARLARRYGAMDLPGARKVHQHATPRLGGVAVVSAILATLGLVRLFGGSTYPALSSNLLLALTVGLLPVFLVSCCDDFRALSPAAKLAGQLAGAAIAIGAGLHLNQTVHLFGAPIPIGPLAIPLSFLWIVGVTNAFNLVDGLDGLSAGLGLISAATLAIVAGLTGNPEIVVLSLVLLGALVGFIPYNLHPARVFLGDSGANAVGFCLACLTLSGGSRLPAGLAVFVPLLAIGVPVADTLVSIVRRLLRGFERRTGFSVLQADREHIHHRLLRLGVNQGRAVLILYSAGVAAAAVGVLSLFVTASNAWLLLAALAGASLIGVGRLGYDEFAVLRRGVVLKLYDRAVTHTGHFKVFIDIGLVMLAFYGAVALKYDDWELTAHRTILVNGFALLPAANLVVFWAYRIYDRAWRLASVDDVIAVNCAAATSAAVGVVLTRLLFDPAVSLTLFAMHGVLLMAGTSAARASFRILAHLRDRSRPEGRRVAIYGAGVRGIMALREIRRNPGLHLQPVGFIDDDPSLFGHRISGLKVLGNVAGLEQLVEEERLEGVLLASDWITPSRLGVAMQACSASGIGMYRFSVGVHPVVAQRELKPAPDVRAAARAVVRPA